MEEVVFSLFERKERMLACKAFIFLAHGCEKLHLPEVSPTQSLEVQEFCSLFHLICLTVPVVSTSQNICSVLELL